VQTTLGTPAGVSLAADIAAIEAQTDDIGVAGAGLTAVPWNPAWDAEVQSEAADALTAYDPPTHAELTAELATADDATLAAIAALNNLSQAQAQTAAAAALTAYDGPTNAELTAALAAADDATLAAITALNDLSAAEVTTAVPSAATIATALIATALPELAAAEPPDTPSVGQALMLPYMMLAQGGTMDKDTGISTYRNGAGTVVLKRTLADDGSVLTENKLVAGP
jgi:hypothetical protein